MKRRDWNRWVRAASLIVALLAVPVSASASLAIGSSDVCSMTCCVKEGHCCCSPHHARVEGQITGRNAQLNQVELSNSCPSDCASGPATGRYVARELHYTPVHHALAGPAPVAELVEPRSFYARLNSEPSSPRGPPHVQPCA